MHNWISATASGISLGFILYACVRMRMHFAPILFSRYGNPARLACWFATVFTMIVLANVALIGLRKHLGNEGIPADSLMLEIWFASLALAVAFGLIFKRLYGNTNMEKRGK